MRLGIWPGSAARIATDLEIRAIHAKALAATSAWIVSPKPALSRGWLSFSEYPYRASSISSAAS